MYNLDKCINRQGTNCLKWDKVNEEFNNENLLPMWIADMDFAVPPGILEGLKKRLETPIFGYEYISDEYYDAVISWMKRKHNYIIEKDWITVTPGVVVALCFAVQGLTEENDEIIVPSPVYPPFYQAIKDNNRVLVESSLIKKDNTWTFDFQDIESKITSKTKAIMICSPHNPNGRVWDKDELEKMAELCQKHDLIVIDDEIHNDIVFDKTHTVFANISEDAANRAVVCTAPSKTFNTAGLKASNIIIKNPQTREKFRLMIEKNHMSLQNDFINSSVIAAYTECDEWLEEMLNYVNANMNYMVEELNKIKGIFTQRPEGTYLLWVDFNNTGKSADEIKKILIEKCHLALNDGRDYGEEGSGFFRINLACPRSYVKEAVKRLKYFDNI